MKQNNLLNEKSVSEKPAEYFCVTLMFLKGRQERLFTRAENTVSFLLNHLVQKWQKIVKKSHLTFLELQVISLCHLFVP